MDLKQFCMFHVRVYVCAVMTEGRVSQWSSMQRTGLSLTHEAEEIVTPLHEVDRVERTDAQLKLRWVI